MTKPTGIKAVLRYFDREYWQMREVLGYPTPYWVQRRWPGQFQDGGTNPYFCGSCEARRRYPELHGAPIRLHMTTDE